MYVNGGERGSLKLQLTRDITSYFVSLAPCVIHDVPVLWKQVERLWV